MIAGLDEIPGLRLRQGMAEWARIAFALQY